MQGHLVVHFGNISDQKSFLTQKVGWNGDQNVQIFCFIIRKLPTGLATLVRISCAKRSIVIITTLAKLFI